MQPNIFLNKFYCQEDYFSNSLAYFLNLFPTIAQRLLHRISILSEKPIDYFGEFKRCEFIGHEYQEDHFESRPDLKIITTNKILFFENKLASRLNLEQMRKHSVLVDQIENADIIFVSNIYHTSLELKKIPNYLYPINSDHFLWADFLTVFNGKNRKNSISDKLINDFQVALRTNGMIGRVIKGANDNLYTNGSDSLHIALTQLWDEMHKIGFKLTKKIKRETTIRAYPVKHQVYPLLNPRFEPTGINFGDNFDKEILVITILSRGNAIVHDEKLKNFISTDECTFIASNFSDSYDYHGFFIIPVSFKGNSKSSEINFDNIRKALNKIYEFLKN